MFVVILHFSQKLSYLILCFTIISLKKYNPILVTGPKSDGATTVATTKAWNWRRNKNNMITET